jgi:hypothetical protein
MASNDSGMSQCNNTNFRQKHGFKNSSSNLPGQTCKKPHSEPLSNENIISNSGEDWPEKIHHKASNRHNSHHTHYMQTDHSAAINAN